MQEEGVTLTYPELTLLTNNKESGYNYRERKQDDWTTNYALFRHKVTTNRLTQRQTVHLPIMKMTVKTLLKDVDDMVVLYFENLDNDKDAEIFKNEYWKYTVEKNNMEIKDIVDKKQVFLYGRTFDQMQIVDGMIKDTIVDPFDILVDRYCDPTDIDSARFFIHTHIFVPLSSLIRNKDYNQQAINDLYKFFESQEGIIKASDNQKSLIEKNARMQEMGLDDVDDPILGETYVELSLHFVKRAETNDQEEEYYLYVEAEDQVVLMKKTLEEVIGVTKDHFWKKTIPYTTWADDVEMQDFWSDAVADDVRPTNQILDVWYSQLVENRTLRSMGMNFYDATTTAEGYRPDTFEPMPFGWYPLPGKPSDVYQRVDIPDLSESLDEMKFLLEMNDKSTGATAPLQGAEMSRQVTLGQFNATLVEAKERIKGMSKYYTQAWKRRGLLFTKLIEAGHEKLDAVDIAKKGRNTNDIYTREISPKDWMTPLGYTCKVWSREEKDVEDTNELQKLNLAKGSMPTNRKLDEIYKRKLLTYSGCTPDEINAIIEEEKALQDRMMNANMMQNQAMPNAMPTQVPNQQPVQ